MKRKFLAAILTPPDIVSQTLMAIPMVALYEISILGARIFVRKKPHDENLVK
jgi:sec-independent protein translocase protein TatC